MREVSGAMKNVFPELFGGIIQNRGVFGAIEKKSEGFGQVLGSEKNRDCKFSGRFPAWFSARFRGEFRVRTRRLVVSMSLAGRYVAISWPAVVLRKMLEFEPHWFVLA